MAENDGQVLARLGTNGDLWAREWLRVNPMGLQAFSEDDLDTMRRWFANAIEAGRSAGSCGMADAEAEALLPPAGDTEVT